MTLLPTAWYRGEIVPMESLPIQPAWEPPKEHQGVFTTTRTFHESGCLAFQPAHDLRLIASIAAMGFSDNPAALLNRTTLSEWVASLGEDVCVRINALAKSVRPYMIWAVAKPLPETPTPTKLAISSEPASEDRRLKRVGQDWRRRAESEATANGVWDVVAIGFDGMIRDGSKANILFRVGRKWFTPPADGRLLPGVVRAALLDHGLVEERPASVEELLSADEIACTNSVRGIVPIHDVEGQAYNPSEATKALQEWFEQAAVAHAK
jgi:para-aminobenzoate synthetase/4-amino-4-deoxychorismate lyase